MLVTSVRKLKRNCPSAVHTATAFCDRIEDRPLCGRQSVLHAQRTSPAPLTHEQKLVLTHRQKLVLAHRQILVLTHWQKLVLARASHSG
jgi:hypothetical protein